MMKGLNSAARTECASSRRPFMQLLLWFTVILFGHSGAWAGVTYPWPADGMAMLGEMSHYTTKYEDSFATIARGQEVGYDALRRLNPDVDIWIPGADQDLVLPTAYLLPDAERTGIVINLSELRLYYFDEDARRVSVYPIGIGSEGTATPLMQTRVVAKISNPTWYPPDSVRARHAQRGDILLRQVPPGPDNPLGAFAVQLAQKGYFIHGTNRPIGVGQRVSAGCIRMYEPHIESLVRHLPRGAPVRVIRQPYKVAWHNGELFLEAHPSHPEEATDHSGFVAQIIRATQDSADKKLSADRKDIADEGAVAGDTADTATEDTVKIDWSLAFEVARAGQGLPIKISR